ncbi:MAG: ABC transporter ATP-binding protein [Lachnospiraceae bacterium]|nr:ABC transporter ATP-binding protein [Lachnospiraceae bacterium]MBR4412046.1 ABC transporter ATP-binding protein [Lachnospiraceae bacterium]MBR5067153.1 ABC transporter ATP-binding protein [Lachnospiraceae bacterium]MBR5916984.1 ABC transporter ATP-binding protein [Lachnospiraceae bacterium]
MSFIEVKGLKKIYGNGESSVTALKDITLSFEKGEFVAVVGSSGSGKSTLLSLLGGIDSPTEGEVIIDGENVHKMKAKEKAEFRRRKIGFVFQEYNLIPVLSVEENIEMPLRLDGIRMKDKKMDELLDMLGLKERRDHLPEQLSGGQKQRVAIGRAYAHHPALILADEPTGNLDKATGLEIMALLQNSARKFSQTMILVTHDEKIAAMADRIITLSDGCVIGDVVVRNAVSEDEV